MSRMTPVLRIAVALLLGPVALVSLLTTNDAHVVMCMLGAITLSLGFIWSGIVPSEKANKLASFAAGWILFYTIVTATTMILISYLMEQSRIGPLTLANPVYQYHFWINFVILLLFWSKIERLKVFSWGFIAATLASPLMLFQEIFGKGPSEPLGMIAIYVLFGLILAFLYFRHFRSFIQNSVNREKYRKLLIGILWGYAVAMIIILILAYSFPQKFQ